MQCSAYHYTVQSSALQSELASWSRHAFMLWALGILECSGNGVVVASQRHTQVLGTLSKRTFSALAFVCTSAAGSGTYPSSGFVRAMAVRFRPEETVRGGVSSGQRVKKARRGRALMPAWWRPLLTIRVWSGRHVGRSGPCGPPCRPRSARHRPRAPREPTRSPPFGPDSESQGA